jgi:hypothetical protein
VSPDRATTPTSPLRDRADAAHRSQAGDANVPSPPSERAAGLVAAALALLGAGVLAAALLFGSRSGSPRRAAIPPPVPVIAATPTPSRSAAASVLARARPAGRRRGGGRTDRASGASIVARPSARRQLDSARALVDRTQAHIPLRWLEGFYGIYATAQRTFGVNWLLIASIHRQETAFSTAADTYRGLNFAGCCGGPMQFNVTNGPVPTWRRVSGSFRFARRPSAYGHATTTHPSIYDDFDSIMAAAHLLSADGAGYGLDAGAWVAAYDYYGHDVTGVTYADEVLARAIGWSQSGFCINCGVDTRLVEAVHAAYGAPVLAALVKASAARVTR